MALLMALAPLVFQAAPAQAAPLTNVKDVLETSAPATVSAQTISYTSTTAVTAAQTIRIGFSDAWTIPGFAVGDITFTGATLVSACGAGSDEVTLTTSNTNGSKNVTFTVCSGDTVAAGAKTILLGTGATKITNPTKVAAAGTADIYTIAIAGTQTDSGNALVAIIEGVTVSVTVVESLTFSMAGVTAGSCTGDTGSPSVIDTSGNPTTIPFGSISTSNAFFAACQLLSVSTNANSGYALTSEENTSLKSGSNTISDTVCDSACSESTGSAWATSTNNGLGHFCENINGTPCAAAGTSNYRQFACRGADAVCNPGTGAETIQNLMTTNAPANNNQSKVHFKLSLSPVQQAGTYSNTVTYIATPTY